jgi:hypothetical protein
LPPATEACRFAVAHAGALDAAVPEPDDGAAVAPLVAPVEDDAVPAGAALLTAPELPADEGDDATEPDELDELHPAASSAAAASAAPVSGTRRERAVTVMGIPLSGKMHPLRRR